MVLSVDVFKSFRNISEFSEIIRIVGVVFWNFEKFSGVLKSLRNIFQAKNLKFCINF
jgi:hypothetical protein